MQVLRGSCRSHRRVSSWADLGVLIAQHHPVLIAEESDSGAFRVGGRWERGQRPAAAAVPGGSQRRQWQAVNRPATAFCARAHREGAAAGAAHSSSTPQQHTTAAHHSSSSAGTCAGTRGHRQVPKGASVLLLSSAGSPRGRLRVEHIALVRKLLLQDAPVG